MQASIRDRILHVIEAIEVIEQNTAGLTFEEFERDRFTQLGVERALEIISEATRHIPGPAKEEFSEIPWRRIADLGNRLRHAYHRIDAEIVWNIIRTELDVLKAAVQKMISRWPQASK